MCCTSHCHVKDPPVVDHLLVPAAIAECPHNYQACLITGGQLVMNMVPGCTHNCPIMALQGLVLRQRLAGVATTSFTGSCTVSSSCCCGCILWHCSIKAEHLFNRDKIASALLTAWEVQSQVACSSCKALTRKQRKLTLSKALSPPHAIQPDSAHHEIHRRGNPPGMAIFLLQHTTSSKHAVSASC